MVGTLFVRGTDTSNRGKNREKILDDIGEGRERKRASKGSKKGRERKRGNRFKHHLTGL